VERNTQVLALINEQVAAGRQIGVQVAAYLGGTKIIDAAAGTMGPADDRPVSEDSLFLSFSSTKGPSSLLVHQLVDQGIVDFDAPVATYWPEFAQNGKAAITVAQAMSHQAGLHALPSDLQVGHLTDWEAGLAWVAGGIPAWEPGTVTAYHAFTFGWLVGGIVEGATGQSFVDVWNKQIAEPLGVGDEFMIAISETPEVTDRVTTLELVPAGDGLPIPEDSPFYEAMPKALWQHFNSLRVRMACMPGANGHFSARGLARMYGALANGGVIDGVELVSASAVDAMSKLQIEAVDRVLGRNIRRGAGFVLGGLGPDLHGRIVPGLSGPNERAFGHSGAGGSVGFADPDLGLGVAVTVNKMAYPNPGEGVTQEICDLIRSLG
jgi:CubicO group peptidase (beta-lactamase class C family)